MSDCLWIIKNLSLRLEQGTAQMGDLFLTSAEACFVPYAKWRSSDTTFGTYSLGGLLTGGFIGGLIGTTIDSMIESMKQKEGMDVDEAKRAAVTARAEDFGRTIDERLANHHGIRLPRSAVHAVDLDGRWCVIDLSDDKKIGFFVGTSDSDELDVFRALSHWQRGELKTDQLSKLEGTKVGLPLRTFISQLGEKKPPHLDEKVLEKVASDPTYIKELIERFFFMEEEKRVWAAQWLKQDAAALRRIMIVFLSEGVLRKSENRLKKGWIGITALAAAFIAATFAFQWPMINLLRLLVAVALPVFIWSIIDIPIWRDARSRLRIFK